MAVVTVATLVAQLQTLRQDLPVFVSIDEEGNRYKPVHEAVEGVQAHAVDKSFARILSGNDLTDEAFDNLPVDAVIVWPVG